MATAKKKNDAPVTPINDAEAKRKALNTALAQIEKKHGQGSVMRLGDNAQMEVQAVSTGSIALDLALGIGGVPKGRIIEIFGPESSGKTTVALHIVAEVQKAGGEAAFIDAEHALDPVYAKALGVDINSLLVSIMVTLARIWEESGISLTGISSGQNANIFSSSLEYIDLHINESLSVQELADRCGMSYSTFARLFKHYTGRSCQEYINYIKVCKAQDLLLFTDYPISYIASEIGFSDCSHLIKTYKKIKGITPNQQRKIGFQSNPTAYETVDKSHSS